MNQTELTKGIIFLLFATIIFSFMGIAFNFYGHSSDDEAHKLMSKDPSFMPDYSPLLRSFSWLFRHDDKSWVLFIMILFALITPLLLIKITESLWTGLFYFALTSHFYWTIQGGYAQGLEIMFIIALFATKNNLLRLIIMFVGLASHSTAPISLPIIFLFILLDENKEIIIEHFKKFKYQIMLGGCSAFWGQNAPREAQVTLNTTTLSGNQLSYWGTGTQITTGSLMTLFLKICPIFFMMPALLEIWKRKRIDLILITIGGLIVSLEYGTRVWYILAIPLLIGFTWYFNKLNYTNKTITILGKQITLPLAQKKIWLVLIFGYLIFQLWMYVNFNLNC